MWIYQYVEGEVHEYFRLALEEIAALQLAWVTDPRGKRLRELVPPWMALVERCRDRLERYEGASGEARMLARTAYIATLDLADFLDRDRDCAELPAGPHSEAALAVLDMLEEWQPYLSIDDRALNYVVLDGLPHAEAIEVVKANLSTCPPDPFDDDCPLCRDLRLSCS